VKWILNAESGAVAENKLETTTQRSITHLEAATAIEENRITAQEKQARREFFETEVWLIVHRVTHC
jgi:hypothetical protein